MASDVAVIMLWEVGSSLTVGLVGGVEMELRRLGDDAMTDQSSNHEHARIAVSDNVGKIQKINSRDLLLKQIPCNSRVVL